MSQAKDTVVLLFDVKAVPALRETAINLAEDLGYGLPSYEGAEVIRLTLLCGKLWDWGQTTYVGAARFAETGTLIWIGSKGPQPPVELPNIGEYKVVATVETLNIGCQQIAWDVVEKILAARPKA